MDIFRWSAIFSRNCLNSLRNRVWSLGLVGGVGLVEVGGRETPGLPILVSEDAVFSKSVLIQHCIDCSKWQLRPLHRKCICVFMCLFRWPGRPSLLRSVWVCRTVMTRTSQHCVWTGFVVPSALPASSTWRYTDLKRFVLLLYQVSLISTGFIDCYKCGCLTVMCFFLVVWGEVVCFCEGGCVFFVCFCVGMGFVCFFFVCF